ncbi:MAG: asparaginase [Acidobacteriota bacterium]|nr:asparaginase [Acidobacteriota bacterium]
MRRRLQPVGLPLILVVLLTSVAEVDATELPRVHLITTGGTISNHPGGRLSPDQLIRLVPDLHQLVEAETEEFTNISSSALTLDQWLRLSRRINQVLREDPTLAGVVVTSGTDTLEELAFFLHLTIRHERPVVLVGSMRRPEALGYDGAANLRQAFQVAASQHSVGRGVLVVLNDAVNSAREVTKTDASSLQTFNTRGYGTLGVVGPDGPVYYRNIERRHTASSEFGLQNVRRLPRVDIVMAYQGASGDLIRAAVDRGADGIVVAGAGAGATNRQQRDAISSAFGRGVFVVMTTRTGSGRIASPRSSNRDALGGDELRRLRVAGEDLAPVKARILLMLALTVTNNVNDVQRMFAEY